MATSQGRKTEHRRFVSAHGNAKEEVDRRRVGKTLSSKTKSGQGRTVLA